MPNLKHLKELDTHISSLQQFGASDEAFLVSSETYTITKHLIKQNVKLTKDLNEALQSKVELEVKYLELLRSFNENFKEKYETST